MLWGTCISILFLIIVFLLLKRSAFFHLEGIPKHWIPLSLLIKIGAGVCLYLLYSVYYQERKEADIFKYYDDALVIYNNPNLNPSLFLAVFSGENSHNTDLSTLVSDTQHWDKGEQFLPNDNRTVIRLNLLLFYLSKDFYFFHLLFFCVLSFIGSIGLFHFFKRYSIIPSKLLLATLILPPSVLLWTSGLLKESLFLFFLGSTLFLLKKLKEKIEISKLLLTLIFFLLLASIKSYLIICLLPSLLFFLFFDVLGLKRSAILTFFICLSLVLFMKDSIETEIIRLQHDFIELAETSQAKSRFEIVKSNHLKDIIIHIPSSIYNVWIRPLFPRELNLLGLINTLESWFYILLLLLPIVKFNQDWRKQLMMICLSLSFIVLATIAIGSTVPIMGAIVRYRSPLIIFYLIALFTFVDWKRISQNGFFNSKKLL